MIYVIVSRLNRCNNLSRYRASLPYSEGRDHCNNFSLYHASLPYSEGRGRRSQKIDDLPILTTCQSGTSTMLSSEVNGPIAHGSTR